MNEEKERSRRVIQIVVQPDRVSNVVLGRHNNLMITSYDADLFIAEGSAQQGGTKLLDAGETITLLNDTNETIYLRSETNSTRVRIILW